MKKIKHKLRTWGFTLIELLVVVAIIAMLSSVAMVALNDARNKARYTRLLQDSQQIMKAEQMYYDKYGKWFTATYSTTGQVWQNQEFLTRAVAPVCPGWHYLVNSPVSSTNTEDSVLVVSRPVAPAVEQHLFYLCVGPNCGLLSTDTLYGNLLDYSQKSITCRE